MNLHSEKVDLLLPALLLARSRYKAAVKDAANDAFKKNGKGSGYATLDSVIDAVNEALLGNEILYTQPTEIVDGKTVLHTRFIHVSGQWIGGVYPVHPVKNDPQGEGSALTYARRYALMALAGIAPEDDDGNAGTKAAQKQNKQDDSRVAGSPSDGFWEQAESLGENLEELRSIAMTALEYWEIKDANGALEFLASKGLSNEAKGAINTMFPPPFRSAMKRAHEANKTQAIQA